MALTFISILTKARRLSMAEACRNLACSGAVPLGTTDNLNMPSPMKPELFWQIKESVRGLADACRAFNAPVTGGNCSLYNQSPDGPIDPTPTVVVVGLIEKPEHVTTQWFKDEGDAIILLGERGGRERSAARPRRFGLSAGRSTARRPARRRVAIWKLRRPCTPRCSGSSRAAW